MSPQQWSNAADPPPGQADVHHESETLGQSRSQPPAQMTPTTDWSAVPEEAEGVELPDLELKLCSVVGVEADVTAVAFRPLCVEQSEIH